MMMRHRKNGDATHREGDMRRLGLTILLCLAAFAGQAFAQTYPTKPIRVIVPFSAGSATDIIARTVAEQLSQQMGQPIVVENRVGASGTIGIGQVAKADPDGYTLLVHSSTFAVTANTFSNPGYDAVKDFAGISLFVSLPNVLIVKPDKYKTLKDLVAALKAAPGKLNYATVGPGSGAHLNGERFLMAAGLKAQAIPYKGGPEGTASVLSGDTEFYFVPLPAARGLIASGKVAALGVSTTKRSASLPNVPTTVEAGLPNSEYNFWVGFWAPAKTPKAIVDKLNAETVKALANPGVREKLTKMGSDPQSMKTAEFDGFVKNEIKLNGDLVKAAGVKIN
jgi:tripartite-type tricarboxylate transporter receptor subunit TctC